MISAWFSWFQNRNVQQFQEPFNDQYKEASAEEDWLEVIAPGQEQGHSPLVSITNKFEEAMHQEEKQKPSEKAVPAKAYEGKADEEVIMDASVLPQGNKSSGRELSASAADTVGSLPDKKLSRQERRAKARLASKEQKKQARIAALAAHYNKGTRGIAGGCFPTGPLTAN